MATFTQVNSSSADASGNNLTVALTGVAAGALIVIYSKWEGAATTLNITGGDAFSFGTMETHSSTNDLHGQWAYVLAHSSGNITWTQALGANRPFRRMHVWEFAYTGTASLDAQATNEGNSTTPSSGNLTATGTDEVVLGGYGEYSGHLFSSPLVNGAAAAGSRISNPALSWTSTWYGLPTSGFTGAVSGTIAGTADWICNGIAFKITAGGASGNPWYAYQNQQLVKG